MAWVVVPTVIFGFPKFERNGRCPEAELEALSAALYRAVYACNHAGDYELSTLVGRLSKSVRNRLRGEDV